MQLLSMGYYLPEDNDPSEGVAGVGWMKSEEANWTRLNAHNHDGVNSQPLATTALSKYTSDLPAASWVVATGGYSQDVTVPAGIQAATAPYNEINSYSLSFYISDPIDPEFGTRVSPTVTRLSSTQFRVFFGDNTKKLTCLYV